MAPRRNPLDRFLIRWLSRRRGSVRAIQDVHYLKDLARFSVLFGVLVFVPVVLLAGLALQSLEAEALTLDRGLAERADAIAREVQETLRARFDEFEVETRAAMSRPTGDIPRTQGLRVAFRFDADNALARPFTFPGSDDRWPEPDAAWQRQARAAERLESRASWDAARSAWEEAARRAQEPAHRAHARLGAARVRMQRYDDRVGDELVLLADEHPSVRGPRGHRIADLATLLRAVDLERKDRGDEAVRLLRQFVERTLAATQVVGFPGDVVVALEAVRRLEGRVDPGWARLARDRLDDRMADLFWAERVDGELRLVAARPAPEGLFTWYAEDQALWATYRRGDTVWALSFDADAILRQLGRTVVDVANRVDPDLSAGIVRIDEDLGAALTRRSLAPRLPRFAVVVRPADPVKLAEVRRNVRLQRVGIVVLAVLAASLGIVAAVRMVNQNIEAARAKADFAANVSHELRSPITQIRLRGESLQLDLVDDDAERHAHYDAIVRETERLSRLVDNVLDFSAIERGVKKYTLRPGDLAEVVIKAVEVARPTAASQGMALNLVIPEDLPVLWLDREAMGQVMTNLISNALKYGADGPSVDVSVEVLPEDGTVEVHVADHGIGIATADQERVFEHFFRVASTEVRRRRGTGIGLTIVRYIVEAHGGEIRVESAIGEGSTFTVTLPVDPPEDVGG